MTQYMAPVTRYADLPEEKGHQVKCTREAAQRWKHTNKFCSVHINPEDEECIYTKM